MGFSAEWEHIYRQGGQNSTWPWSDLVSYVMRYARPAGVPYRVLELGAGAGANVPFFLACGVEYHGTEGSASAVLGLRERFAGAKGFHIACCDFTQSIPFQGPFDLVVDRSSLTHNGTAAIRKCLLDVCGVMRSGGKLIGIDWFSTAHGEFPMGTEVEDRYTRTGFAHGQFRDVGIVHFSDEQHLRGLVRGAGLEMSRLEHAVRDTILPEGAGKTACWHFVAVKP